MHFSAISKLPDDPSADLEPGPIVFPTGKAFRIWPYLSKIIKCIGCLEHHGLKEHFQFLVAAVRHRDVFEKLTQPHSGGAFARLMAARPRYVSLLIAPYVDARWSSTVRVDRLIEHCSTLRGALGKYDFPVFLSLHLLDLGEFSLPGYHIVIDKPPWFCHEGLITLNIFKHNFRFFSVTFSFQFEKSGISLIIGGIQGRKTDDILTQYRNFTHLAHGVRPRDFLMEVLRMIARAENVQYIRGVPDRFRYHRHSYFSINNHRNLYLDYDETWKERGGVLTAEGMYEIPLQSDRNLGRIAAKKRAMYRRRYALLDQLEGRIALELHIARPVPCGPVD